MTDSVGLDQADYLRRLFDDFEFSFLVIVVAQLGIADLVAPGPRSAADLAEATGTDTQSLYACCGRSQTGACSARTAAGASR